MPLCGTSMRSVGRPLHQASSPGSSSPRLRLIVCCFSKAGQAELAVQVAALAPQEDYMGCLNVHLAGAVACGLGVRCSSRFFGSPRPLILGCWRWTCSLPRLWPPDGT